MNLHERVCVCVCIYLYNRQQYLRSAGAQSHESQVGHRFVPYSNRCHRCFPVGHRDGHLLLLSAQNMNTVLTLDALPHCTTVGTFACMFCKYFTCIFKPVLMALLYFLSIVFNNVALPQNESTTAQQDINLHKS